MKRIIFTISILFAFSVSNAQIIADFVWSDPQCSGGTIVFNDNSSTMATPITEWSWSVEGVEVLSGYYPTFDFTFPTVTVPTDYDISLQVTGLPYSDNVTYTVTIYPHPTITVAPLNPTACEGESMQLTAGGALTYEWSTTETGATINPTILVPTSYTVTGTDSHGCADTTSTTVSVNIIDSTQTTDEFCEATVYDFHGTNLTAPGTYYQTLTSVVTGCDSVIRLDLVMNPVDTTIVYDEFCQGSIYNFIGTNITTPGTYYHTTTSSITGCNIVIQLELAENLTYYIQQTEYICNGGSYTWPVTGSSYSTDGIYTETFASVNACDSIYELVLIVNPSFDFTTTVSICNGDSLEWFGNWYDATGIYTNSDTTINGCDSVYSLDLTVNALPQIYTVTGGGSYPTGGAGVPVGLSGSETGIDYSLMFDGAITISTENGTGNLIDFGNQIFVGDYTVIAENHTTNCTDEMFGTATVTIITSINEISEKHISVYPNPTSGLLSIKGENIKLITITDLSGKVIFEKAVKTNSIDLDLSGYSKAVYFVKVQNDSVVLVEKIVLE